MESLFQGAVRALIITLIITMLLVCAEGLTGADVPPQYFKIKVVDEQTGRGVPLVELQTVNNLLYVTDSNGIIAFCEPGLKNQKVFFFVKSHGYEFPTDGLGYRGTTLQIVPGGSAVLKLKRINIAERICRLTGAGIYSDSLLVGEHVSLREAALAGQVTGQDTAFAAIYRGRMLWFWGDTSRPGYPLGNFRTTGAVAGFPQGHRTADSGLDFQYFTREDGFVREMCPSQKPGPIWISGLTALGDPGKEELYAYYARMEGLEKKREHGYVRWDDARKVFTFVKELPASEPWRYLQGHPVRLTEHGTAYLAGGFCFPVVRVPADPVSLLNPDAAEAFTCLTAGGDVRRDAEGNVLYQWQKEAPPILPLQEADLVRQGKLKRHEAHFLPRDPDGNSVLPHGGSVTWNPWRKKWLLIATQREARESALGEIIYAEATSALGPWQRTVKIVTHDRYTFYNPVHHPFLDEAGGRIIYFEGTYTAEFSGNTHLTPRYNYNQILYRLDLADPRLKAVWGD